MVPDFATENPLKKPRHWQTNNNQTNNNQTITLLLRLHLATEATQDLAACMSSLSSLPLSGIFVKRFLILFHPVFFCFQRRSSMDFDKGNVEHIHLSRGKKSLSTT